MKLSDRGFQLSVTFLVMLIISIVIFGMSLYLVKKFFSATEKVQVQLSTKTQKEIEQRMATGELVSIPLNKRELRVRDTSAFGLGMMNIVEEKDFYVKMNFNKAFRHEKEEIKAEPSYIDKNWIFTDYPPVHLKRNENIVMPLQMRVDGKISTGDTTVPGTYVFNVCVFTTDIDRDCILEEDETIGSLQNLYTKRMYKIYVNVVQ